MTLLKRIKEIKKLIHNSKNPFLFFDADDDGTSSLFQLKKVFPQIKDFAPFKKNEKSLRNIISFVNKTHDLILFFDIPYIEEWFLDELKGKKIVWVDHHIGNYREVIKKHQILYLNPLDYNKNDSRSASYFAYKISSKKENLFFCVLGTLADSFLLPQIVELYKLYPKEFKLLFNINFYRRKKLFSFVEKNKFNSISDEKERREWIDYLWYECGFINYKNYFELLYKFGYEKEQIEHLNSIIDLNPIEFAREVNKGKSEYNIEFNKLKKDYNTLIKDARKRTKGPLVYYEHSGKNSFNRQIAEELAYRKKKGKVIISVFKKEGKPFYSASIRGKTFDVEKMIKECLVGLNGSGGGHKYSVGVGISEVDFEEFKKRIEKYVYESN